MLITLEYESGHAAEMKAYKDAVLIKTVAMNDTGDDVYSGSITDLDAGLYMFKYYVDGALVYWHNQIIGTGLVIAESCDSYVTVESADSYMNNKLRVPRWDASSDQDKLKALIQATSIIDSLAYIEEKVNVDQIRMFPRTTIGTPDNILKACCEIALALINNVDPESELLAYNISETKIDGATVKLRGHLFAHLLAGVPSVLAWRLLKPYFITRADITLKRTEE